MKKKFSAVTALTLTLAMVLTACSGGGGGETTAAAGGNTEAAGETTQAAAPSGDAVKMTMGTGGTTGTYYAFGGVIANVLNAKDIGVNINVQSTGASKANIYLVNDGEADLAIVQNAFAGIRVCVCVLIFNAVVKLWKKSVIDKPTLAVFLVVFAGSAFFNLSPILFVILAAVAGILLKNKEVQAK